MGSDLPQGMVMQIYKLFQRGEKVRKIGNEEMYEVECPTCLKVNLKKPWEAGRPFCNRSCYMVRHRTKAETAQCPGCGKNFARPKRKTPRQTCSRACSYTIRNRNGHRYLGINGYFYIKSNKKYQLEHRLVVEREIGRKLKEGEHVHHINGIHTDNRPENLQILTHTEHSSLHYRDLCDRINSKESRRKRWETRRKLYGNN